MFVWVDINFEPSDVSTLSFSFIFLLAAEAAFFSSFAAACSFRVNGSCLLGLGDVWRRCLKKIRLTDGLGPHRRDHLVVGAGRWFQIDPHFVNRRQ